MTHPLAGKVVVVTGGAQGIGRALVDEFVRERVRSVVVFDRDVAHVASSRDAAPDSGTEIVVHQGDVSDPQDLDRLVRDAEDEFGRIDVFCSNAGVMSEGGVEVPDPTWQRSWDINVMAHVRAARRVLPGMVARHEGVFLNVLSAAAFLTAPGAAPYTVTKHAALGFAEWLAINFAGDGIGVSAVCPEAVDTPMLQASLAGGNAGVRELARPGRVLSAEDVASHAVRAVKHREFLVTPHPRTLHHAQRKWSDVDEWIRAMSSHAREKKD